MKVSLSWLRDYVDIKLPVAELARRLAMAGTEVKGWQVVGGSWENIFVGQVLAINPHPNADRLTLPTVDLGTSQQTVVCGAPNLKLGDKVAFARVGAQLIDGHTGERITLKAAKIRGVVSEGMVCSEKELGISPPRHRWANRWPTTWAMPSSTWR
jgi:phenylalanyl-tRNA synthetase beta chain